MELNFEQIGSVAGSALPIPFASQIGTIGGKVLNVAAKLLGGPKTDEKQQSADVNQCAQANRITGEQAAAVIAAHCDISSDRFNDLAAYCAKNNDRFVGLMAEYNNSHPGAKIVSGNEYWQATQYTPSYEAYEQTPVPAQLLPTSQRMLGVPAQLVQTLPAPASQQNLTGQEVKDVVNSGLDGLRKGVTDGIMKTEAGKQAQNAGAKQWLNDNGLIIGVVLAVLMSAFTFLISTRKK